MGREERERRKAARQEKFEAAKAAMVARVVPESAPKAAQTPSSERQVRLAPHLLRKADEDLVQPKASGSRFGLPLAWCVTLKDIDGQWSWEGGDRQWTDQEWDQVIAPGFREIAGRTWAEIDALASGTGHKLHHGQDICDLHEEAQVRWSHRDLEEFADSIFRFRFGALGRAWGFVLQAHFHMVWWDRSHKIYVSKKKDA